MDDLMFQALWLDRQEATLPRNFGPSRSIQYFSKLDKGMKEQTDHNNIFAVFVGFGRV